MFKKERPEGSFSFDAGLSHEDVKDIDEETKEKLTTEIIVDKSIPLSDYKEERVLEGADRAGRKEAHSSKDKKETNVENLFDEKKARQITGVIKDWIKYEGSLYGHLTGKDLKLERGVDYKDDHESWRRARQEKIDNWLQDSDNQKWINDAKEFQEKHKEEIAYKSGDLLVDENEDDFAVIERVQADGRIEKVRVITKPYYYIDDWLFYSSNYFDKRTGKLKQPERESAKYRIYFNCKGGEVFPTYQEVIEQLSKDSELQRLGFKMKTADLSKLGPQGIAQIMNQKDRIILYLGEKGIKRALPILQRYVEQNREKFNKEGILLAQPIVDSRGQEISGVTITSETTGNSPDTKEFLKYYSSFNDMQSKIISSVIRLLINSLRKSEENREIKDALEKLSPKASEREQLKIILSYPNGEELLIKKLQLLYPKVAKSFGMREDNIAFKDNFAF